MFGLFAGSTAAILVTRDSSIDRKARLAMANEGVAIRGAPNDQLDVLKSLVARLVFSQPGKRSSCRTIGLTSYTACEVGRLETPIARECFSELAEIYNNSNEGIDSTFNDEGMEERSSGIRTNNNTRSGLGCRLMKLRKRGEEMQ